MEHFFFLSSTSISLLIIDLHYAWWHLRLEGIAIGVLSTCDQLA